MSPGRPRPAAASATIEAYIAAAPVAVRPILKELRRVIRAAAPEAEELISYRMPAFRMRSILVYFAAFKAHIGLYPPVSGDASLERALAPYAGPKGNLRFPLDKPIPYGLVRRIVQLRVRQDRASAAGRAAKRPRANPRPGARPNVVRRSGTPRALSPGHRRP